jgi:hypothetical protein
MISNKSKSGDYVETDRSNFLLAEVGGSDWVEIVDFTARPRA